MTDPQQPWPVPPPVAPAQYAPPAQSAPGMPPYSQPAAQPLSQPAQIYQPPPGAFAGPAAGYAAPYVPARTGGGPAVGRIALLLALVATVALTLVGAVLAWQIGHGVTAAASIATLQEEFARGDLTVLTPVRELVLWWEITAWSATAIGIWAIVQSIVAIAKRRGRGAGIAALIIAAVGPFVFFVVGYLAAIIGAGLAAH